MKAPTKCPSCLGVRPASDLMCTRCWFHVPRPMVALFRLVWKLVHAGLLEVEAREELERMLVKEARAAAAKPPTPPHPTTMRTSANEPRRARKGGHRGDVTEMLMNALPRSESEAVSAAELAARAGHPSKATVQTRMLQLRKLGHPQLRAIADLSEGPRPRWRYWRAA